MTSIMAFRGVIQQVWKNSVQLQKTHVLVNRKAISCSSWLHTTSQRQESFNVQDTNDFQERVKNETTKLTLVDFHATWCGPCKILGPRLEEIAGSKEDIVNLAKVDVDANTDLAMEYNISSVPTVLIFKNGENVDKFIGVIEKDRIEHYIEKYN